MRHGHDKEKEQIAGLINSAVTPIWGSQREMSPLLLTGSTSTVFRLASQRMRASTTLCESNQKLSHACPFFRLVSGVFRDRKERGQPARAPRSLLSCRSGTSEGHPRISVARAGISPATTFIRGRPETWAARVKP